jgi:hypothetical protein
MGLVKRMEVFCHSIFEVISFRDIVTERCIKWCPKWIRPEQNNLMNDFETIGHSSPPMTLTPDINPTTNSDSVDLLNSREIITKRRAKVVCIEHVKIFVESEVVVSKSPTFTEEAEAAVGVLETSF